MADNFNISDQPGGGGAGVDSFEGRVGVVVSAASDYDASQVDNDSGVAGAFVDDALDTVEGLAIAAAGMGPVDSVFGRTGVVVAADDDYAATQLSDEADGSILSWSAAGEAVLVGPGVAAQVLTSNGPAAAPSFQAGGGGGGTPQAASVFASGDVAVPNTTNTVLDCNSENFDTDSMHDNSTDNSRLTINTAGTYVFGFDGRWENDGSGFRRVQLVKNGSTVVGSQHTENVGGSIEMFQCATFPIQEAIVTDFFEIFMFQNSGGALDMEGGGTPEPTFWCHRLS